ncbi:MAG: site-specific DNA-methyltransferase [Myxococcota bacterium]
MDSLEFLQGLNDECVDAMVTDPPAGIGFMGKAWDKSKGGRDKWIEWMTGIMREALRVMKPGAHGFVWALPRTSHWTMTALEDAGFEVRDVVHHIFGTGFPKSHNVSKAIDKAQGLAVANEPVTKEAREWGGWGTALKPAAEHWILVRKPLVGTVAKNVLEHGTGGIHVDACRVGTTVETWPSSRSYDSAKGPKPYVDARFSKGETIPTGNPPPGRWPPNVVLGPEAAEEMDRQAGHRKSGAGCVRQASAGKTGVAMGRQSRPAGTIQITYGDEGGASRYFPQFKYQPKPSTREKSAGLEHRDVLSGGDATGRKDGSAGTRSPRAGAGRNGGARNPHPTVKPIELMRWLCRLITPPGGAVLDPFVGSGTTGCAAVMEGFEFIGCDMSEEYVEVARARIKEWRGRAA